MPIEYLATFMDSSCCASLSTKNQSLHCDGTHLLIITFTESSLPSIRHFLRIPFLFLKATSRKWRTNGPTGQESPDSFLIEFSRKKILNILLQELFAFLSFSCEWSIRFRTTPPDPHLIKDWNRDRPYRKAQSPSATTRLCFRVLDLKFSEAHSKKNTTKKSGSFH